MKIDFSKFLSIKIGTPIDVTIFNSIEDIDSTCNMIGCGKNLLVGPEATNLAILGRAFDYIKQEGALIQAGAATKSSALFNYFKSENIGGLEFLRAIPGSIGGLVKMNAGVKEFEIKNVLHSVLIHSQGRAEWVESSKFKMEYRESHIDGVILAARFQKIGNFNRILESSLKNLRKNQPSAPSFGSCFKNPPNNYAARLIEGVGLRGRVFNGLAFSKEHANFLVNLGGGTFDGAIWLIQEATRRVHDAFGVHLIKEVKIFA